MNPVSGRIIPETDIRAPDQLSASPTHEAHRTAALFLLADHRNKQHFASMYIYIHIETPTNYIPMHLYLYLYICRVWKVGWKSRPLPALKKTEAEAEAESSKAITFLFTAKDL